MRDGHYRADWVPVGTVRVTFMAIEYTGRNVTIMGITSPESNIIVPRKYRAGIDIEVCSDDQMRNFDLNDDRPTGAGPA